MSRTNRKSNAQIDNQVEAVEAVLPETPATEVGAESEVQDSTPTTKAVFNLEALVAQYGNKSNAIRAMSKDGFSRSYIAIALGIRYQHVRNVLLQPLKRAIVAERAEAARANEVVTTNDDSTEV